MTLRLDTRLFTLAKDPELPDSFQDACCVDTEHHIAAVADGVSSSLFSGPWAAILAEAVVADSPNPLDTADFAAWLRQQRERWAASIDTSSLAWFQKAKLPRGAFSTLLYTRVCALEDSPGGSFGGYRLVAYALGDSCLFHIRNSELVRSFPLDSVEQFDADPIVLGSVDLKRDHLLEFAFLDEVCYPGDELILCTDAVAEWALHCYTHGDPPVWNDFWQMSDDDWRAGVAWLRQERQMRTDDATMLMLRVNGDPPPPEKAVSDRRELAGEASAGSEAGKSAPMAWIESASQELRQELKSVTEQMAQNVDHASEQVIKGLRGLKDRAMKKYRETFGKKDEPPE